MMSNRALVCGASQGIGRAIAMDLAEKGHRLTLVSRSEDKLKQLAAELSGEGHDYLACDLGQPQEWLPEIEKRHGEMPYTVLVLNSGGPPSGPISQATPEDFLSAMNGHLATNALLVKTCLPAMKEQKFGRIITVTSTSVKMPIPHLGVSNTVRAAVASWGKTLSFEVAPFGITVNNIMPGFTETPRLEKLISARAKASGQSEQVVREQWLKMVPSGRFCKPEETAALASFLISENAGSITGQNIAVDGGRLGCL